MEIRSVAQDCAAGRKKGARILQIRKGFWQAEGPRRGSEGPPPGTGRAAEGLPPAGGEPRGFGAAAAALAEPASRVAKFTLKYPATPQEYITRFTIRKGTALSAWMFTTPSHFAAGSALWMNSQRFFSSRSRSSRAGMLR